MEESLFVITTRRVAAGAFAIVAALAPLALLSPQTAQAASFDCAKAATAVEKTICGDAELSKLDETLGAAYARALVRSVDPKALKTEQRAWLRNTRDACADAICLKAAYEARIAELGKVAATVTEGLPLEPVILNPPTRDYRGFEVTKGIDEPVCQGIEEGLRERDLIPSQWAYCGAPFPEGSSDFRHVLGWNDLDPAENMELLREIFYLFNARKDVLGPNDWQRQLSSRTIIPELFKRVWQPSEGRIRAAIESGRMQLQYNWFDVDNDGKSEAVYRITAVQTGVRYKQETGAYVFKPPAFVGRSCWRSISGWPDPTPYIYFVDNEGTRQVLPSNAFPFSNLSLFKFKDKTYLSLDGSGGQVRQLFVLGSQGSGAIHNRVVCSFRSF